MSQSARNSYPGQLLRTILSSVDDSGPQQLVKVTGLAGQTIGEAVRSQHFGFTSVPPEGAEGLALLIGGGMDRAHILGCEHPQYRPTGLPGGTSQQYDQWGNHVDIRNGVLTVKHASQIVVQVGGCTLTITSSGFAFAGGTITHNGHDIGATHEHTNVTTGSALTGPPQ